MSSWREREERGGRYGDHLTRWGDRERDNRGRSPVWERDRSSDRGSRDRYDRDRRDRDRRERDERRRSRDRYDRPRDRERRRSPRRYEDVPTAPSPPRISHDEYKEKSPSGSSSSNKEPENMVMSDYDNTSYDTAKPDDNLTSANASPGDWLCLACGSYNFKRRLMCFRRNCQGKRSESVVYGNDPENLPEGNSGITKKILFRRLDALTTEEKILDALKERCSKQILDSIAGITIGRETLTGASKCMAFINFNSISDSTAAHTELTSLYPPIEIDGREVLVSFYNEPQKAPKNQTQKSKKFGNNYYNYPQYGQYSEPLSEADRVNAAAAVAQSAISAAQARQMSWAPISVPVFVTSASQATPKVTAPVGDGKKVYTAPDVRTFLYDETSGYYYDPATGLYYDGNTQYFFNSQTNQYMYWDSTTSTYIAATQAQQNTDQPKLPNPPEANADNTISKEPEEKKKKDKEDKVKVAKKIAKDMERWARTLNHKKEIAKSNVVVEQPQEVKPSNFGPSKGSADIGFSVLGAGPSVPPVRIITREVSPVPINVDDFLIKKTEPVMDNDEGIIDWTKLTCLLCKRRFPSVDVLTKHKTMSDLHKQNLAEHYKLTDSMPQANGYRDRAAERRMKFGEDDAPPMRKRYEPPEIHMPVQAHPPPSVVDTIGGKMLQKMGWSQGRGLGKEEQGRIAPIEAEQRPGLAGLGQKRGIYTPTPGETYRDTVKKLMIARYKEVVGQEDGK